MNTPHLIKCTPQRTFRFGLCSLRLLIFTCHFVFFHHVYLASNSPDQLLSVQLLSPAGRIALISLLCFGCFSSRPQQMILPLALLSKSSRDTGTASGACNLHADWHPKGYNVIVPTTWVGLFVGWFVLIVVIHWFFYSFTLTSLAFIFMLIGSNWERKAGLF